MGFSTLSFCRGCLYRLQCKQLNNINFVASHSDFSSCKRSTQSQVWRIRPVTACVSNKKKPRSSQKYLEAGFKALEKEALVSSATKNFRNLKKWKWEWPPWEKLPKRYKLIAATALAFVICNMDKVNLSVAIIPLSHQFGWSSSTAGLVQSSFFWGYAVSQLPGGWLAKQFTGKRILGLGVLVWSLATAFVPVSAGFIPGLIVSRIVVGIGEGVSPPSATDLIARSVPFTERARAVSFVFGGLSIGSILGLLLSPFCIEMIGWESVFYLFGFLGLIWYVGFQFAIEGIEPVSEKQFLCNKESMQRNPPIIYIILAALHIFVVLIFL